MPEDSDERTTAQAGQVEPDVHRWHPIEDLPQTWSELADGELKALRTLWSGQRDKLADSDALADFNGRLVREWCIETGILENLYTLDRGVTQTLVEQGLDAALIPHGASDVPPNQLVEILRDHHDAIEGLFVFVKSERSLSTSYIKELHAVLTRHQTHSDAVNSLGQHVQWPLLRGEWKSLPNNPGHWGDATLVHEYCPPEHTAAEMDRLIAMHHEHVTLGVPVEVEAAWLHHRFTEIHPFQDGNGRVARSLATLVFLRAGAFPLVVLRDDYGRYIGALRAADRGDIRDLVALFASIQKRAFMKAVGISEDLVTKKAARQTIIHDAAERLRRAWMNRQAEVHAATDSLVEIAFTRFTELAAELVEAVGPELPQFTAKTFQSTTDTEHYFTAQIVAAARHLDYFANISGMRRWVQLRLRHGSVTSFVVSFHHLGRIEAGVVAVSAFIWVREADPPSGVSKDVQGIFSEVVCDEPFTIVAGRDTGELRAEFESWLERAVNIGLEAWRRKL